MAVLTLGLMIGFSSCKDDDDDSIVGKWVFSEVTANVTNPENPEMAQAMELMVKGMGASMMTGATLDVKSDGTFVASFMGETTSTGTYTEKDGKYTINVDGEDAGDFMGEDAQITVKGGVLTISSDLLDEENKAMGFTKYIVNIKFKK
ncbi:hypothetical protein LJC16_02360 [Bacteroidales bacterium OttesenSCG-928-C19]|nr:hypothetical protein [Bacteroidales bacterium OttesenSCG-928-C19]